jgi:hypothetical protein
MSSGWPPEDDDRRWEPARHPSAVGAGHDSRGAERGYSGFAHQDAEGQYSDGPDHDGQFPGGQFPDGQYPAEGYADGQYQNGEPSGWYGTETSYPAVDYQPEPGNPGYGEISYPDVYDLAAPADGGFSHQGYGPYEPAPGYGPPAGYTEHPSFPNLPAQPAYGAPAAADYDPSGYQDGYAGPDFGQAEYPQAEYPQAGYPQAGQAAGYQQAGQAAGPDYGYADYGDPRYDDPSFGELAYADPPPAGYPAPNRAPAAPQPGQQPGEPYSDYYQYPPSYDDTDHGHRPAQGYAAPDRGPAGYVAAEYASGQFPEGVGTLGDLPAGQPDPAVTGMLDASGMLDTSGISDHVDLYNYHPGAGAEAAHTFADAPAPMGTLDTSGLALPPDATMIDGYAPILGGAEAADATGVLDGGTASTYFAEAPAFDGAQAFSAAPVYTDETTAYAGDGPAYAAPSGPIPAFNGGVAADVTSLDLASADSFGRGPASGVSGTGASNIGATGNWATSTGATKTGGTGALLRPRSTRPAGKRRGGSGDRRLWFALGGVLVVAAVAIVAIVLVAFPSGPSGPAHTLVTPNQLGAFGRRPALEQQMNVSQLRQDVVNTSSGQARHVVEGVYESGNSVPGSTPQIILFIGGNLANANPVDSVTSFTKRFKGATVTSAGTMAGKAVCVDATAAEPGSVAMCAWFDNDSFGEVVSPTMKASALANTMRQIRPKVELIAKQKS